MCFLSSLHSISYAELIVRLSSFALCAFEITTHRWDHRNQLQLLRSTSGHAEAQVTACFSFHCETERRKGLSQIPSPRLAICQLETTRFGLLCRLSLQSSLPAAHQLSTACLSKGSSNPLHASCHLWPHSFLGHFHHRSDMLFFSSEKEAKRVSLCTLCSILAHSLFAVILPLACCFAAVSFAESVFSSLTTSMPEIYEGWVLILFSHRFLVCLFVFLVVMQKPLQSRYGDWNNGITSILYCYLNSRLPDSLTMETKGGGKWKHNSIIILPASSTCLLLSPIGQNLTNDTDLL